jgi:hypothetical protein
LDYYYFARFFICFLLILINSHFVAIICSHFLFIKFLFSSCSLSYVKHAIAQLAQIGKYLSLLIVVSNEINDNTNSPCSLFDLALSVKFHTPMCRVMHDVVVTIRESLPVNRHLKLEKIVYYKCFGECISYLIVCIHLLHNASTFKSMMSKKVAFDVDVFGISEEYCFLKNSRPGKVLSTGS